MRARVGSDKGMARLLQGSDLSYEATYEDVFLVPSRSAVRSRLDIDLASGDGSETTIPIIAANMTAVSGRRMAETIARRGGLAVITQDIPVDVVADVLGARSLRAAGSVVGGAFRVGLCTIPSVPCSSCRSQRSALRRRTKTAD